MHTKKRNFSAHHLVQSSIFCFYMALLSFRHDPAAMISSSKASIYQLISACSYDNLLSSVFCAAQAWLLPWLRRAVRTLYCPAQPGPDALPRLACLLSLTLYENLLRGAGWQDGGFLPTGSSTNQHF